MWRTLAMTSPCSCNCNSNFNSITLLGDKWSVVDYIGIRGTVFSNSKHTRRGAVTVAVSASQSRRSTALLISSLPFSFVWLSPAEARRERRNKNIPIDDYVTTR